MAAPSPTPPAARPLAAGQRLSERLAEELRRHIDAGTPAPGERLPTEQALATQYGVSRTVVREAVSGLKSMGLLVSRQGSGVFVAPSGAARALDFDPAVLRDLDSVIRIVEVRRALEGEVAALAAERARKAQVQAIERSLKRIDEAVAAGRDGVAEDLDFHRAVAEATGNPQFKRLLAFLEQYQRHAMQVTRTNEALEPEFMAAVRREHRAIADAIAHGDSATARAAATEHMVQAARRLQDAQAPIRRAMARLVHT